MRRRSNLAIALLVGSIALAACGSAPSAAAELAPASAQPTILQPPDEDRSVGGDAEIVIQVDGETLDARRADLEGIVFGVGGWISSTSTGTSVYRGDRYDFGTYVLEVPEHRFSEVLDRIEGLGERVSSDIAFRETGATSTIVATLTESPAPSVVGDPAPRSRIDSALDTAGDVLLTILSVLIVAGAVIIPVLLLTVVAYAVWRAVRRRWPLVEDAPVSAESAETTEPSAEATTG